MTGVLRWTVTTVVVLGVVVLAPAGADSVAWGESVPGASGELSGFVPLRGPHLGQQPPGGEPQVFAPGIVSTGMYERDIAISADGQEIYYGLMTAGMATIMVTQVVDGVWSEPEVASFAREVRYHSFEPCLSADGKRVLFLSTRPPAGKEPRPGWGHQNIWAADRREDGSWGEPYDLGAPVNTDDNEYYPSLTADGTLYFTRSPADNPRKPLLMRARWSEGKFAEPEALPAAVNGGGDPYNAFIAPDESFLLACVTGAQGAAGATQAEYSVFFRSPDDLWSEAVSLGPVVNRPGVTALSASLSPDGRFLFFASSRTPALLSSDGPVTLGALSKLHSSPENGSSDIYWVAAALIEQLRERWAEKAGHAPQEEP